jgi:predicted RNase H-like HicB family nuclease
MRRIIIHRMIHEAIELHLEDLIAHGEPVPAED